MTDSQSPAPADGAGPEFTRAYWQRELGERISDKHVVNDAEWDQVDAALWETFLQQVNRRLPEGVEWQPTTGTFTGEVDLDRVTGIVFPDAWDATFAPDTYYHLLSKTLGRRILPNGDAVRAALEEAAAGGVWRRINGVPHWHVDPVRYGTPPCC